MSQIEPSVAAAPTARHDAGLKAAINPHARVTLNPIADFGCEAVLTIST
jgi:hypothetical protein